MLVGSNPADRLGLHEKFAVVMLSAGSSQESLCSQGLAERRPGANRGRMSLAPADLDEESFVSEAVSEGALGDSTLPPVGRTGWNENSVDDESFVSEAVDSDDAERDTQSFLPRYGTSTSRGARKSLGVSRVAGSSSGSSCGPERRPLSKDLPLSIKSLDGSENSRSEYRAGPEAQAYHSRSSSGRSAADSRSQSAESRSTFSEGGSWKGRRTEGFGDDRHCRSSSHSQASVESDRLRGRACSRSRSSPSRSRSSSSPSRAEFESKSRLAPHALNVELGNLSGQPTQHGRSDSVRSWYELQLDLQALSSALEDIRAIRTKQQQCLKAFMAQSGSQIAMRGLR